MPSSSRSESLARASKGFLSSMTKVHLGKDVTRILSSPTLELPRIGDMFREGELSQEY